MRLFVGLGNPGSKYANNRHNIGFMAVDEIARRHGFAPWRRRFQGETSEGTIDREKVVLLRPTTYMNESGRAVQEAANFFKLSAGDVTVFQDELELPAAKVRVKIGGGIAGHNGLRSISSHIGNDYRRVRLGIGHPGVKELVHSHVLSDFAKSDRPWVEALCEAVADNAGLLVTGKDSTFQNKVHLTLQAKGFFDKRKTAKQADFRAGHISTVMRRPCAGHPRLLLAEVKNVDARDKPGHDDTDIRGRNGIQMRYRWPAQCRQVDAVQRADRDGSGAGGELSVLHHRAECRRGRRA